MAVYGLRFRGEWLDKLSGESRFDIFERDFTGGFESMDMQEDPLDMQLATRENKFTPTVGCGIDLHVFAEYDGQYMSLYTKDKQKYKYEFTKNGKLISRGYMNSEVYNEGFDRNEDYEVSLQFNDGFTVLERIKFLDANGNPYTDLKTAWEVIWIILAKLNIDYKYVYVACDIYEENMNTLTSPFHQMKVDCNNYYDEKGDAMNCREVLEAIVKTQRAICFQNEGCLNIVSVPLLTSSFERRRYTSEASAQVLQTVNPVLTVPTQADWYASDQAIDIQSGYNKATLKYSPYGIEDILAGINPFDQGNWLGDGYWFNTGVYWKFSGVTPNGWNLVNGAEVSGSKEEELDSDEDFYFSLPFQSEEAVMIETNISEDTRVSTVENQTLSLKLKMYVRTKDDEYNSTEEASNFGQFLFKNTVEIAGERPVRIGSTLSWSVNNNFTTGRLKDFDKTVADQWQDYEYLLPVGFKTGSVKWIFAGGFECWDAWQQNEITNADVKEIRIKDVKFELVNLKAYTSESGSGFLREAADFSDIEFVAEMDDEWLNEADDIEMIHGDSKENNCTDKGGLHLLDNSFTGAWKTPADAVYYDIAKLYLRSYVSNYRDSLRQLAGTLEAPNFFNGNGENINGILSFHSILTYPSTSLGSRKLMFMGGTYNDKRQTLNGTWLEVLPDDLTINSL